MGGPGKYLDRNYHYSAEKDLNFIAYRTLTQTWYLSTSSRGMTIC
jgi:hypothetical protein